MVFSEDFAISQGELRLSQLPDLDEDFYHFSHLDSATVGQTSEVAHHIHEIDTKVSEKNHTFIKIDFVKNAENIFDLTLVTLEEIRSV